MLCWIDHVWSSKECVCCACDPNERLSAPFIGFVCVFVCWKLYPAVAVHLSLWYVLLVCHQYDVCENSVGSVYVGGYGGLSESGLCVFCKLCPVCFLVVGKGPSVLL